MAPAAMLSCSLAKFSACRKRRPAQTASSFSSSPMAADGRSTESQRWGRCASAIGLRRQRTRMCRCPSIGAMLPRTASPSSSEASPTLRPKRRMRAWKLARCSACPRSVGDRKTSSTSIWLMAAGGCSTRSPASASCASAMRPSSHCTYTTSRRTQRGDERTAFCELLAQALSMRPSKFTAWSGALAGTRRATGGPGSSRVRRRLVRATRTGSPCTWDTHPWKRRGCGP
mmetsp:Transcript_107650/g.309869  ORF Transcript_107650/g.309869 Transcript_107650/m.309869 type:complete len:229 (+) Transcript_107650:393-1079(+)